MRRTRPRREDRSAPGRESKPRSEPRSRSHPDSKWIKTPPGYHVGHPPGGSRVLAGSDEGLRLEFAAGNLKRSYAERLFKMWDDTVPGAEKDAIWKRIERHFGGE